METFAPSLAAITQGFAPFPKTELVQKNNSHYGQFYNYKAEFKPVFVEKNMNINYLQIP